MFFLSLRSLSYQISAVGVSAVICTTLHYTYFWNDKYVLFSLLRVSLNIRNAQLYQKTDMEAAYFYNHKSLSTYLLLLQKFLWMNVNVCLLHSTYLLLLQKFLWMDVNVCLLHSTPFYSILFFDTAFKW
jgi:hypothetical protein